MLEIALAGAWVGAVALESIETSLQVDAAVSRRIQAVVLKPFEPADLVATIEGALHADSGELVT